MKNKYVYRSRISEKKFREVLKLFSLDLEADQTAKIVNLSRNTINKYYKAFRERIVMICNQNSPLFGEIEGDESYFGARSVKG
jgi:transposase